MRVYNIRIGWLYLYGSPYRYNDICIRGQVLVEFLPFLCLISFLKNGLANLGPTHLTFFKNLSLKLGALDDLFWRCGTFGNGSFVDSFHITATAGTIER